MGKDVYSVSLLTKHIRRTQIVTSFFFLRILCPALVTASPMHQASPKEQKQLIRTSKILQALANHKNDKWVSTGDPMKDYLSGPEEVTERLHALKEELIASLLVS